jgi:hypothetical protein
MNIKLGLQLVKNMGLRYTLYRVKHELQKKLGYLVKHHPANPPAKIFISLDDYKAQSDLFFWNKFSEMKLESKEIDGLKTDAEKIFKGDVLFFSNEWKSLGDKFDWITNPDTGFQYDINQHWSNVQDLNPDIGDIKYVWEKSRFSFLLTVIRHDHHFKADSSAFVFKQIESWIDANPINQGPNYRCSQEISLRMMNWSFALNFYKDSENLTPALWNKIQNVIYWQLQHVYKHIDFSRIAVRNNHAITETLMLTISELLFPFIPETKLWSKRGREWFEEEVDYQVYDDGTFLQFSMNYHRVLTQLLTFGISITEHCNKPFSKNVKAKAYKSVNFLYQCLQEKNGELPNYGSNDGALFFPFSTSEYRDYRPQLNALHHLLTGADLFPESNEEKFWFGKIVIADKLPPLEKVIGTCSFPNGGYYTVRTANSFVFLRCGNHKDRPAHADNLHLDYWVKGVNLLQDSGTYQYNTTKEFQNYFTGSNAHNTVVIDGKDQMLKGSRFIWYFWSQVKKAGWTETETEFVFNGEISAFAQLGSNISHSRTVRISKGNSVLTIVDAVKNTKESGWQLWHSNNLGLLDISASVDDKAILPEKINSFYSSKYGLKIESEGIKFIFDKEITTHIKPID